MTARWYVAHVEPGEERRVCRKLAERSKPTWLPDILGEPVLPGYVLVESEGQPVINGLPEIIRLLPSSLDPLPIPADQIEIMQACLRAAEAMAARKPLPHRGEAIIAGLTRTALANLLQSAGIAVKFRPDTLGRVEPQGASRTRSNAGHRQRRNKRAA